MLSGSPPLARDKFSDVPKRLKKQGITPACAGQIWMLYMAKFPRWDHPRLRGTNKCLVWAKWVCIGSPPLARDKCYGITQILTQSGITPACAGQISPSRSTQQSGRDHPRLRGTNVGVSYPTTPSSGSPPLARDKFSPVSFSVIM